jgi:hypothetical protein
MAIFIRDVELAGPTGTTVLRSLKHAVGVVLLVGHDLLLMLLHLLHQAGNIRQILRHGGNATSHKPRTAHKSTHHRKTLEYSEYYSRVLRNDTRIVGHGYRMKHLTIGVAPLPHRA